MTRVSFELCESVQSLPLEDVVPPDPVMLQLRDEEARILVREHKDYLRQMVQKQRKALQSLGYHMNNGSLRSIVSGRLDRSSMSLHKLEQDITEATEELTEQASCSLNWEGNLYFDFDEEQRAFDLINSDEESSLEEPTPVPPHPSLNKIEVSPSEYEVFRGAAETWQAIRYGCTIATSCKECQAQLHVIEDAEHVVCMDCWTVGPVIETVGGLPLEYDGSTECHGIGLGIKAEEIIQWVES